MIDKIQQFKPAIIWGIILSVAALIVVIVMKYFLKTTVLPTESIILIPLSMFAVSLISIQWKHKLFTMLHGLFGGMLMLLLLTDLIIWILIFYNIRALNFNKLLLPLIIPLCLYVIPFLVLNFQNKNRS